MPFKSPKVASLSLWSTATRAADSGRLESRNPLNFFGTNKCCASLAKVLVHFASNCSLRPLDFYSQSTLLGWREARSRGIGRARQVVFIGDGAAWIWELRRLYFAGAVEILDLYHEGLFPGQKHWADKMESVWEALLKNDGVARSLPPPAAVFSDGFRQGQLPGMGLSDTG